MDPPRGNYKDRKYFNDILDNNLIFLDSSKQSGFSLEPLVSRIDGRFKVAISKSSICDTTVAVVSCRLLSILNPVLPLGYTFTITDQEGKTIFDSDSTHNLNENLLDEFTNNTPIISALSTKTRTEFDTRYEDDDYSVLVQPIGHLPYFITIMEQKSYETSLNTQCVSFTMMMMMVLFLFLCLEIILVLISHFRNTKLRKNAFDLSWIYPRQSMNNKYFFLFLYNIGLMVVLALFCLIDFSIVGLNGYIFLFIMSALISSIAACSFGANFISPKSWKEKTKTRKRNTMIALSTVALFVVLYSHSYSCLGSTVGFSFVALILFYILNKYGNKLHKDTNKDFMKNFRLMIFTKILLISGLPVIIFFACIYNFEQKLQERLILYQYAKNIEAHVKTKGQLKAIVEEINSTKKVKSFYTDNEWIAKVKIATSDDVPQIKKLNYNDDEQACLSLLKTSRLQYNNVSNATQNFELIKPDGTDSLQFVFNSIFENDTSTLYFRINEINGRTQDSPYLVLKSSGYKKYNLPIIFASPQGTLFWFLFFVVIVLTFQLMKYAINKIFGRNVPGIEDYKLMHDSLLENDEVKYLFVQGIPGTQKSTFIKSHLEMDGKFKFYNKEHPTVDYNATSLNLEEIPDADEMALVKLEYEKYKEKEVDKLADNWLYKIAQLNNPKIQCIVFSHFEYKIVDDHTNKIKLNLIERLIHSGKKKIIISSDMDPLEYFQSLRKFMEDTTNSTTKKTANDSPEAAQTNAAFSEYMNRWNNLLGRFTNIFNDTDFSATTSLSANSFSEDFINKECSYPVFMHKYKDQFNGIVDTPEKAEDHILKLQSLSDHSYRQIWASLTKEEQLTLFDLAEDGLVNTSNYQSITMLMNKGLVLKKDGMLVIMNSSFRNFMLTGVNSKEVESIEKEINDGQTWNDYKYPVLILLGALVYFVLSSNPEKFGNVLPIISGIMAGIPAFLKLISYMKPADARS